MSAINLISNTKDEYRCHCNDNVIKFSGAIAFESGDNTFKDYLEKVHVHILNAGYKKVSVDIVDLDFLNSSAIKVMVDWVASVHKLYPEFQYKIIFIQKEASLWQEAITNTLVLLSPENVSVAI